MGIIKIIMYMTKWKTLQLLKSCIDLCIYIISVIHIIYANIERIIYAYILICMFIYLYYV